MSRDNVPPEFWERADEIISLVNNQAKSFDISKVSTSLLYAAARYNAFNVSFMADNAEEMAMDKEKAIDYFTEQYRKMLIENLDEHIANFSNYKTHR